MTFDKYKIVFYVPKENLKSVISSLSASDINYLGNYKNCLSWVEVESTWESMERATPYNGVPGKITLAKEYRVEFLCEESNLK